MAQAIRTPIEDKGQWRDDDHSIPVPSVGFPSAGDGGHVYHGVHDVVAAAPAETITAIRTQHRERIFWMDQRKRSDLALGAYLRTALGWSVALPTAERETIRAQAAAIIAAGEKHVKTWRKIVAKAQKTGVPVGLPDMPAELRAWAHIVVPQIEMRGQIDALEASATKAMTALASKLPVHEWANGVRGFGPLGLAIIIGETGDLGNYANPGKVWKRMGVAVVNGKRQGGPLTSAPKSEWIERGYSRVRRSRLYTIGVSLLMAGESPYRQLYLDRKAYERARAEAEGLIVAPAGKIPKAKQAEYRSLGHIDNRSRRYVEKRLLRDLWKAWRGAERGVSQDQLLHASSTLPDAQREARPDLPQGHVADTSAAQPQAWRGAKAVMPKGQHPVAPRHAD